MPFVNAHIGFTVFHPLIQLSPHVRLSKGIEDAFKTAATEVSLLAGTDEFNATELFGVGETLLVFLQPVPHSDISTTRQQHSFAHLSFLTLGLRSMTAQR